MFDVNAILLLDFDDYSLENGMMILAPPHEILGAYSHSRYRLHCRIPLRFSGIRNAQISHDSLIEWVDPLFSLYHIGNYIFTGLDKGMHFRFISFEKTRVRQLKGA